MSTSFEICSQEIVLNIIQNISECISKDDYINQITEEVNNLKKIKEIYEKEINLLKSSILINSLNLNNSGNLRLLKEFSDDQNKQNLINDKEDSFYQKNEIVNYLLVKIKNFKQELDLFKVELLETKTNFLNKMSTVNEKITLLFKKEIEKRKKIEEKVSNIEKLI